MSARVGQPAIMPSPLPSGRVPSASRTTAASARAQSTMSSGGAAPAHSGISLVRIHAATFGLSRSAPTTPRTSAVCHARSSVSR